MIGWLKLHYKAILYFFVALILFAVVGAWVLFTYYYEDILNTYALPKLQEAALSATNGKYRLKLGNISYHHHTIWLRGFDLYRVKYEEGAKGVAVKRVEVDSLQITGINLWKILIGQGLVMTSLQMDNPRLYMTDLAKEKPTAPEPRDSLKVVTAPPRKLPVIAFDSIALRNIQLYLPDREYQGAPPSFAGIHFKLTDFYFNSETKQAQPVLFSKRADIGIPNVKYPIGDGTYALEFKNLKGNSQDSTITADRFGYEPTMSDEAFAAKYHFAKGRINFHCDGLKFEGVNFVSSITKANIIFRKLSAHSWLLDSYEDMRKPRDTIPATPPTMPNDVISSLPVKVHMGLVILSGGKIRIRERNEFAEGEMGFDNATISVTDISKDTLNPHPSFIKMSAIFLGAPLEAEATYPLYEKTFNLDLRAALGSFDGQKLNEWLVPFNRLQIKTGTLRSGKINMIVRNGVATTTVLPLYDNFEVRMLAASPNQQPGLMDKIKSFVAEAFIIKDGNPNKAGQIRTGTTTLPRARNVEFMQFLWYAIRKSLGQVIGGFS